jgi:hypothetical protein
MELGREKNDPEHKTRQITTMRLAGTLKTTQSRVHHIMLLIDSKL